MSDQVEVALGPTPTVDVSYNKVLVVEVPIEAPYDIIFQSLGIQGPPGPAGQGVPVGGTTGQVLAKTSNANYATNWVAQSGGGGITAEDAVDSVAAALVAGNNIDIAYNDTANTITVDVEPLTKSDVGLDNVDNTSDANKPVSTDQSVALGLKADKATAINTAAPLSGGGDLSTTRSLTIAQFGPAAVGVVPASGGGTANFLRADGTWNAPAGGGGGISTEDAVDAVAAALVAGNNIDVTYNDVANTITVDVEPLTSSDVGLGNVDNTSDANKPVSTAQAAANALKADKATTISTTAPLSGGGDLSANRTLTVGTFGTAASGVVPASGGGTTNFLRADGTWQTPAGGGGGLTDGDKGDITVGGSGTTLTIDDGAVTNAKLATMSSSTIKGKTGTTGSPQDLSVAQVKTLLNINVVDNTSDANKPVSTAQAAADALKADKTTTISTTAPLAGGGDLSANRTLSVATFGSAASGVVPASGGVADNFLCANGTWTVPLGNGIPLVSAIPGSPTEGQVIYYQAPTMVNSNIIWTLRYRSTVAGTNKWEVLGAPPWLHFLSGGVEAPIHASTYADFTGGTIGPSITLPRPGYYLVNFSASIFPGGGGGGLIAIRNGATAPTDAEAALFLSGDATGVAVSAASSITILVAAASTVIKMQGRSQTNTAGFDTRRLSIIPLFIG